MNNDFLRCCSYCSAFLITVDGSTPSISCAKCRRRAGKWGMPPLPYADWAPLVKAGDRVFLQPYVAWRGLSRSEYLVTARDGDVLTVQLIGVPESSRQVEIAHCAAQDVTPMWTQGAGF